MTPMLPISEPWSAMISSAPAMAYMPPEADIPRTRATTFLPVRSWYLVTASAIAFEPLIVPPGVFRTSSRPSASSAVIASIAAASS